SALESSTTATPPSRTAAALASPSSAAPSSATAAASRSRKTKARSSTSGCLEHLSWAARNQTSPPWPCRYLAVLVNDLAAADRRDRPAGDLPALVGGVVGAGLHPGRLHRQRQRWVPQHQIRIRSNRDRALAREHPEQARRVGGGELDELVQ